MSASSLLPARAIIRRSDSAALQQLADTVIHMDSAQAVKDYIRKTLREENDFNPEV